MSNLDQTTAPDPEQDPPLSNSAELINEGMVHFARAMEIRSEMNVRVAKRVTSLVRGATITIGGRPGRHIPSYRTVN